MPNLGTTPVWLELWNLSGQSYKQFTLVIYDSRVVIYECKLFIRLATGIRSDCSANCAITTVQVLSSIQSIAIFGWLVKSLAYLQYQVHEASI